MSTFPLGTPHLHIEVPGIKRSPRKVRSAIDETIRRLSNRERDDLDLLISELVSAASHGGGSIVLDIWRVFSGVRVEGRADRLNSIGDARSIGLFDRLASQWQVGDGLGWFFLETSASLHEADDVVLFECVAAGDSRALAVLLTRYREFAVSLTRGFSAGGGDREDVEQVAMIGLVKAIGRFDPNRGFKFTTFARPTIRGELKRWLRSSAWAVHVSRGLQELNLQTERAFTEVSQRIGHEASIAELSVVVGVDRARVELAVLAPRSQEALLSDRTDTEVDSNTLDSVPSSVDVARTAVERVDLSLAFERLPKRDRFILYLRFFKDLSQSEIGERLGFSQMHVSRLLAVSLAKIRSELDPKNNEAKVS
ncbi:hypothetical protein BH23ACT4_BH23ACT4_08010 [soil metagenome]